MRVLRAAPAKVRLRPEPAAETPVWAFDGQVPGPLLRLRHGDELALRLVNETERPLSVHWHGVRSPNAMDGVGGLTQDPVAPGQSFEYRFTPPDPGTFLIRPCVIGGSAEPLERGLAALLIVEEKEPPRLDGEFALLLDDWRLAEDGTLEAFEAGMAAAGRLGNWLTVNGAGVPHRIEAAPGSRLRLRLANACNARVLALRFDGLKAVVAAIDGQPTGTFEPLRSTLPFPPGSRYDVLIDSPAEAGASGSLTAAIGQGLPLVSVAASGKRRERTSPEPLAPLPANPRLPTAIRLQDAVRKDLVIEGGPAGPGPGSASPWRLNGRAGELGMPPLLGARRGSPVVLTLVNRTPLVQPVHLHGHVFRLLHALDDGWEPYWLDTLQVPEGRTVRLAFVADNPGRWLLASTVMERFDAGLWTWFEVT